ncbi:MAG: hypothetical protein D6722_20650, partial [Bacteroidetes bacterium]
MEENLPLLWSLVGAGLLFLWLGIRGWRRGRVMGVSGREREAPEIGYYLVLTGYWLAAVFMLLVAASQFHRLYGGWMLALYLL